MKKYIYLIDDDKDFLEILTTVLEDAGYRVNPKSSPQGLIEEIAGDIPDAVILDFDLPHIDGLSLAKKLRKTPQMGRMPILLMSAHRHASQLAKDSEVDVFLPKPFDIHHLVSTLNALTN